MASLSTSKLLDRGLVISHTLFLPYLHFNRKPHFLLRGVTNAAYRYSKTTILSMKIAWQSQLEMSNVTSAQGRKQASSAHVDRLRFVTAIRVAPPPFCGGEVQGLSLFCKSKFGQDYSKCSYSYWYAKTSQEPCLVLTWLYKWGLYHVVHLFANGFTRGH